MHRCFPRPAPVLAPVPLLLRHDQASSHSNASTSAAIRCGLVSGRRDRSASSAAPSRSYRAFQPYTDCREAPYRAATSATGDPLRTSSTACRRCSPSHLLPSEDSSRSPATKAINDRRSQDVPRTTCQKCRETSHDTRMPSRTVAVGPTCGARVAADPCGLLIHFGLAGEGA